MGKNIGSTLVILLLVVIGLAQCAERDISISNKETGESQSLLQYGVDKLLPSAAAMPFLTEADEYYSSQDYSAAVDSFTKAIGADSKSVRAYLGRGYAYQYLRQHQKAIEDFGQVIQLDPQSSDAYMGLGRSYKEMFQTDKAVENFSHALEIDPQLAEAYIERGLTQFVNADDLEMVVDNFNAAIDIDPDSVRAYKFRAMAYMEVGNFDQALRDLNKVIEMEPNNSENYRERGNAYAQLGNLEKALDEYSKAINLRTDNGMVYQERGFINLQLNNNEDAVKDLTKATELIEKSPLDSILQYLTLFGRGVAYARMGEWALSIDDFSASIAIVDDHEFTYRERGYVYIQVEEYEKAMQDFETYLRLAPNSPDEDEIVDTMQSIEPYLD